MKIFFHWIILSAVLFFIPSFVANIVVSPWWVALIVGAILYFVYSIVKPVIKILTLPINLVTFGLFSIALNVLFFWFPSKIIGGFKVETIVAAVIGSLIITVINWLLSKVF